MTDLRGVKGQVLKGHLDLLLLAAVGAGPAHGYAIVERLRQRSGGMFHLAEGTVYPALHRLEQAGLLRSRWSAASGRRRRVYELTARGRAQLEAQQQDWWQFSRAVSAVLGTAT
jgi:transcriptional regulator